MAVSCISVSVSAGLLGAVGRDGAVVRQSGRVALTGPSLNSTSLERSSVAVSSLSGKSLFVPGSSRAGRNAAIAARAADLEQGLEFDLGLDSLDSIDSLNSLDSIGAREQPSSPPPPPVEGTKLYVGNLPWSVHSKQLAEIFQTVGNVELVEVIYDRETQKSRGFAFVTMSTVEDAQKAIGRLDASELDGRVIKVNFPASNKGGVGGIRSERPPRRDFVSGGGGGGSYNSENKLFVGNLSWGVDDVSLDELFSEYGKVLEAKVVHDRQTGRSRGFGFVTLSSASEVNHAISALDGAEFDGRQLRVNLAGDKPPPREPRDY